MSGIANAIARMHALRAVAQSHNTDTGADASTSQNASAAPSRPGLPKAKAVGKPGVLKPMLAKAKTLGPGVAKAKAFKAGPILPKAKAVGIAAKPVQTSAAKATTPLKSGLLGNSTKDAIARFNQMREAKASQVSDGEAHVSDGGANLAASSGNSAKDAIARFKAIRDAKTGKISDGGASPSASSGPKLLGNSTKTSIASTIARLKEMREANSSSASGGGVSSMPKPWAGIPGPDAPWPDPFWAGGQKRTLKWTDDSTGEAILFQATLVEPWVRTSLDDDPKEISKAENSKPTTDVTKHALPLLVYFSGIGSKGGLEEMNIGMLRRFISVPLVLVAPFRAKQVPWWVLSSSSIDWGWVDGQLVDAQVQLLSNWISSLLQDPGIDEEWVSLLGFSAGAYAVTELVAASGKVGAAAPLRPRSLVLGGVHGHGQPGLEGLDEAHRGRRSQILAKWQAYLARLSQHCGAPGGIFAVHCRDDDVCPWTSASKIFAVLGERQRQLGLPRLVIDEVPISEAKRKKSKLVHNYNDRTFCREDLLKKLLPLKLRPRNSSRPGAPVNGATKQLPIAAGHKVPSRMAPKAIPTKKGSLANSLCRSRSPRRIKT